MYPAAARSVPFTDRLATLYAALEDAGNRCDAQALAALGWELFEMASEAQRARRETVARTNELRVAACVVAAGRGSPASLALLRTVLAGYGWLPAADATPLQVLCSTS